jgi:hypothetical protein
MDYDLPAIIKQVHRAQRDVARLENVQTEVKSGRHGCDSCHDLIENIKIELDAVHTNLIALQPIQEFEVTLHSFLVEAHNENEARQRAIEHLEGAGGFGSPSPEIKDIIAYG